MSGWLLGPTLLYNVVLSSLFNIEELEHLKYGIEIDTNPVLMPRSDGANHVMMSSKYGQKYSCVLPNIQTKDTKDGDLEDILNSFQLRFHQPDVCVHRTKGWWTYRVCYGNIVQQYHQPDRRRQDVAPKDAITIGVFEKDFNWMDELNKPNVQYYEQLPHAHKQYFTGGAICDDTGQPRQAVVSLVCDPGTYSDYISVVEEREVCSYKIVINTNKMCKHGFFIPGHRSVRHNVVCSPLVATSPPALVHRGKTRSKRPVIDQEPSWVGNYPTTPRYTLRDYIDDITDQEKQEPLRALKKMFRNVVKDMKRDITNKKADKNMVAKNPELENINLDKITDTDIDNIFKSEEFESAVNRLAKETQQEIKNLRLAASKAAPRIEIKVIYRDVNGDMKISGADGDSPALKDTILQLVDFNSEQKEEERRFQTLQNSYHYLENTEQNEAD